MVSIQKQLEDASEYLQNAASCEATGDYKMACYYFHRAGDLFADVARSGPHMKKYWNDVGRTQQCVAKCKEQEITGTGISRELRMHAAAEEYVKAAEYYAWSGTGIDQVVENYTLAINLHVGANNPARADALRQKIAIQVGYDEMKRTPNVPLMNRIMGEIACNSH